MDIAAALELLQADEPILVRGRTFEPRTIDPMSLDTGETLFWVYSKDGTWMSIDPEGEEVIFFEDVEEELEPEDDMVVYQGTDYELSYEGVAIPKEVEGSAGFAVRDYESSKGDIVRLIEDSATSDVTGAHGRKVTEDVLQEA
jgi:hypothetical protein